MSHFMPAETHLNYHAFSMAQDDRGVQYFATKSGLLHFDGREWTVVAGAGAIYTVASDEKGGIFFGGSGGFGAFDATMQRLRLWSDSTVSNVYGCLPVGDRVYFLNDEGIYSYEKDGTKVTFIKNAEPASGLYQLFGLPYVAMSSGKLLRIVNDTLSDSPTKVGLGAPIVFASQFEEDYLVGTDDSKIFLVDKNLASREIELEDAEYAEIGKVVNGVWVSQEMAAVGTLRGGVIFFNPLSGKTEQIINYSTGLPDNEVFALMCDKSRNIWVAHDYGFTRIAPYLPFRSFSHYSGLKGNLLCARTNRDSIYVGTSQGMYRLTKQDVYQDVVYYVTVTRKATMEAPAAEEPDKKEKKGFFSFLKRNRDKNEEQEDEKQAGGVTVRQKRTKRVLLSSSFVYKPVEGIDSKISQLQVWDGRLIASGLSGIFTVNGLKSRSILEQPVKFLLVSEKNQAAFFYTYNEEFGFIRIEGGEPVIYSAETGIKEAVHYLFEGPKGEIWFCGLENIYRAEFNGAELFNLNKIKVNNPAFDETIGTVLGDKILFGNSSGIYALDENLNASKLDSISSNLTSFFASSNNIWFTDQHQWHNLVQSMPLDNIQFLALLHDVRYLKEDKSQSNLWIISGHNELFRFDFDKIVPYNTSNPVFLKEIDLLNTRFTDFRSVRIDEQNSKVSFKAVLPDFLNGDMIAYRYKLDGLSDKWSDWAFDNTFEFPFLPSGDYKLLVEARNVFGKVSTMTPASFEVLPPYWRRSWFYAMEVTVFTLLVILSFRLSSRYRIVSRLLSLLTIILLIEFIQTVLGATFVTNASPVTDFFIQVVVALLILPVEGYLRNLMLRSLDTKSGFYRLINPEAKTEKQKMGS